MPANRTTQTVKVEGLKETLRAFNAFGKDASAELRKAAVDIAKDTATAATSRATTRLQQAAAQSIKARSDRTPSIAMGGSKKVTSRGTAAGNIFFGAEFGGGSRPETSQFPPHRGQDGYFLWPTIRDRKRADIARWQKALDELCDKWGRGG